MSRRNRHKKKKLKLQKKISRFAPVADKIIDQPVATEEVVTTETTTTAKPETKPEESAPTHSGRDSDQSVGESIIDAPTRKLIASDVRMIFFTLLGLALILTVVKILSLKTGYIDSFGNWLYKITNIQTM